MKTSKDNLLKICHLHQDDIAHVLEIQTNSYPPYLYESAVVFESIIAAFPDGCLGIFNNSHLIAYIFSHPWVFEEVIPINKPHELPRNPDCFYIHDMAVRKLYQGQKISTGLIQYVTALAVSIVLPVTALVAVRDSEPFWEHWGFRRRRSIIYGDRMAKATYMWRSNVWRDI